MILKLNNQNPTKAEKQLFFNAGYYCIEQAGITVNNIETEFKQLTYAVVYGEIIDIRSSIHQKIFPQNIEIDNKNIDYDSTIVFDTLAENVKISTFLDLDLISCVQQRMNELGFESVLKEL